MALATLGCVVVGRAVFCRKMCLPINFPEFRVNSGSGSRVYTSPMKYLPLLAVVLGLQLPNTGLGKEKSSAAVVTDWNNMILTLVRQTPTAPPPATRAFAMMHLAMFDAVNGVEPGYDPYNANLGAAPAGASAEVAAAAAAHTVLVGLYPSSKNRLDAELNRSLAPVKRGRARDEGLTWGRTCGKAMLASRASDGANLEIPYEPADESECGRWQPTPAGYAAPLFPQWPFLTPFAMPGGDAFRADPPPACNSMEYALDFLEVQILGAADSESRTADQTEIAYFWEDGPNSVTPPGRWQLIAQELAARNGLSLTESARLFALLSLTQADGAICAWDSKYHYDHWRPVTAIRVADTDGNEMTEGDPNWSSAVPTPPFPAYTSGHSTFSGGSAELLELFFEDRAIPLSLRTPNPPIWAKQIAGKVRSFSSLRAAAEEAGQSRIYGGIHWQYDNTAGLETGRALARFLFANHLRPMSL